MEVHHPHQSGHKKNWKEYITEFVMLFAAVSLGFLAENIREQYVEKERAHELVSRFEVDVKNNIHFLDSLLKIDQDMEYEMDTVLIELFKAKNEFDLTFFFKHVYQSFPRFLSKNDTYEQMKSSGSLRYIKDQKLLSMMIEYTNETEGAEYRSREQEANYVHGPYALLLTKWTPPALAINGHLRNFENGKVRLSTPDSLTNMMSQLNFMKEEKPYIIRGLELELFKKEMIPSMTRRIGLMKTTMNYFIRSKKKGKLLIEYLDGHH